MLVCLFIYLFALTDKKLLPKLPVGIKQICIMKKKKKLNLCPLTHIYINEVQQINLIQHIFSANVLSCLYLFIN